MNTVLDAPVATTAKPSASLLDPGRRAQWQGVNRVPFVFEHRLAHHPLFTIPRLARLAELAIAKGDRNQYVSDEDMLLSKADRTRRQLDDIARLAEGKHWLKIASVNKLDPEYDDLLQTMMAEIEVLAEARFRDVVSWSGLTVFMNSPHLEVPYHFDHDTNFLMQVQGEKDVYLFDPDDRTVLTEAEIEDFYRGNALAGRYRDDLKNAGTRFHLSPGLAVHHPPLAPHLIRNGDEVSISVAFFFTLPRQDAIARVYQSNHLLRKLGLKPLAPGQSEFSDRLKSGLIKVCSTSKPVSYNDLLYSGVNRITSPIRLAKRIAGRLRAP